MRMAYWMILFAALFKASAFPLHHLNRLQHSVPNGNHARHGDTSQLLELASVKFVDVEQSLEDVVPSKSCSTANAAVIVNMNARSVTEQTAELAKQYFTNVYITSSGDEARAAVHDALSAVECKLLIPIGGDGTLTSCINDCIETLQENHFKSFGASLDFDTAMKRLPIIGYIPLGTGNGVGSAVGCQVRGIRRRTRMKSLGKIFQDLETFSRRLNGEKTATEQKLDAELIDLPMIHVANAQTDSAAFKNTLDRLCFFAGVGFDSMMLDDFKSIKQWSSRTGILPKFLSSVSGYCVALIVKTLPKAILRNEHNIHVKVTTTDPSTLWIDHRRGDFVLPVGQTPESQLNGLGNRTVTHRTTLFEGTTGILAAGTAPFYGGSLRLFPFARLTINKMHLRIGRIHPVTGFFNIPGIFAGSYRDKSPEGFGCLDFLTDDVVVELKQEFPFQHSGESIGKLQSFRMQVPPVPVRFVSLLKPR